jgi:hypothetical protein
MGDLYKHPLFPRYFHTCLLVHLDGKGLISLSETRNQLLKAAKEVWVELLLQLHRTEAQRHPF